MLDELAHIENPLLRGAVAALGAGSIAAIVSATVVGIASFKGEPNYQAGLYATFAGGGLGAVGGLAIGKKEKQAPSKTTPQQTETNVWKDWRNFVIVRKVQESKEITSFYFQPEDKGEIPNFQPGQFLTIKLDIPGQPRPVIRTYSLSDYAGSLNGVPYYRLSIKREPAPKDSNFPPGIASNFMHDRIQEGSVIPAKPPSGKFLLDVRQSTPVVLVSNGVGITPMMAMAKAVTLLNPQRPVWFFHGARDGSFHAFRDEVRAIAQQNPNLSIHYAYSKPRPEDEGHYQSVGYVDVPLIQSLVKGEADYFLCGSPAFMDSLRAGLKAAGVPDSRVDFEMFMKANKSATEPAPAAAMDVATIVFSQSQKTVPWQTAADNLLEFAESQGLNPDYSCRQGVCGTCECKILEGDVTYHQTPTAAVSAGSVLICISRPKTDRVVLDL